jgi:hypothetical protein
VLRLATGQLVQRAAPALATYVAAVCLLASALGMVVGGTTSFKL